MTRRPTLALLVPALVFVGAACNTGFDPQYLVKDVRILSIKAEVKDSAAHLADPDLGDTLTLEALVANPLGRAPLHLTWLACLPTGTDALPPCLDADALRDPARLAAVACTSLPCASGILRLTPGDDQPRFDLPIPPLQAAADAIIQRATAEPEFQCRLYAEIPILLVVEANGRVQSALKRVRLAPTKEVQGTPLAGGYLVNHNPQIESVIAGADRPQDCLGGGTPLVVPCNGTADCGGAACRFDAAGVGRCDLPLPAGQSALCAISQVGLLGAEVFNQCAPDGTRTALEESLSWQWYVSAGTFADTQGVGNATGLHVDLDRPPGPFTLWVILRDGRGGESWERRDFDAVP